jgi:hypothetical protein
MYVTYTYIYIYIYIHIFIYACRYSQEVAEICESAVKDKVHIRIHGWHTSAAMDMFSHMPMCMHYC